MRIICTIICFFSVVYSNAQCSDINELREIYIQSHNDLKSCNKLHELTKNCSLKFEPVAFSYNIISNLMKCNFILNPFLKYKIFKNSTQHLDSVIYLNPKHIEIRFLRYLVQLNSPRILSYNANLDNDYKFIIQKVYTENEDLKDFILTILNNLNNERGGNISN